MPWIPAGIQLFSRITRDMEPAGPMPVVPAACAAALAVAFGFALADGVAGVLGDGAAVDGAAEGFAASGPRTFSATLSSSFSDA
ncbi:hypothetical protein K1Y78_58630, partial [Streptomyces sp. tea 10]|nr:hypothetical protein [Streptomyces sp. tea 10]